MCENPDYALLLKIEYDKKFKEFGVRSQMRIIGKVIDVVNGNLKMPNFPSKYYHLIIKECGQCRTCRFKKSAQKAAQAYCESKLHKDNCFITLTFDKDKLYDYYRYDVRLSEYMALKMTNFHQWSLENELFTKFMKRLRQKLYRIENQEFCIKNGLDHLLYKKNGEIRKSIVIPKCYNVPHAKIKLLHCGEYGSLKERPHHHAILFGYNFNDCYKVDDFRAGKPYKRTTSKLLEDTWTFGKCSVDPCNYNSINYVSRYVTKKITGKHSDEWYKGRKPEYCTQSNRRGLGYDYFVEHIDEYISTGKVAIAGKRGIINVSLPRYFRELWKKLRPESYYANVEANIQKSLELFEKIKETGFESYCKSQSNITKSVAKRMIRQFEREPDSNRIPDIIKKARSFGIDDDYFILFQDTYRKYLSGKSFRCFEKKYNDEQLHERVLSFERWRRDKIRDCNSRILSVSDDDNAKKER